MKHIFFLFNTNHVPTRHGHGRSRCRHDSTCARCVRSKLPIRAVAHLQIIQCAPPSTTRATLALKLLATLGPVAVAVHAGDILDMLEDNTAEVRKMALVTLRALEPAMLTSHASDILDLWRGHELGLGASTGGRSLCGTSTKRGSR